MRIGAKAVAPCGQRSKPMPALFAYLIALCLLFGAGYGALNWLTEPPVKVAAKAKSKSKSQPSNEVRPQVAEAPPQVSKSDDGSAPKPSVNDYEMASSSSDQQIPPQAQPSVAMDDRATPPP